MLYQQISDGTFGYTLMQIRQFIPNASIPDNAASVGDFVGYKEVAPPISPYTKNAVEVAPVKGVQQWNLVDATADEIKERTDNQAILIRDARNTRLRLCDWTQILNGSPLTPEQTQAYAVYRDKLRNITTQAGFPWSVYWPVEPSTH